MTEGDSGEESFPVWDGEAEGNFGIRAEETRTVDLTASWRSHVVIRNVFHPSLTVIRPAPQMKPGASMIVLPGGGFGGLAWDIEGIEVGQFLADRGITAYVLKYRVQRPRLRGMLSFLFGRVKAGVEPALAAASADAKQAIRLVRARAHVDGTDPGAAGMLGFSAGAITMLRVLTDADHAVRPNFVVSVYGFLWDDAVLPDGAPALIAAAEPDAAVADARKIGALWDDAGAPNEVHIFASGDHGFGLGRTDTDSARFAGLLEEWLVSHQYARRGDPLADPQ